MKRSALLYALIAMVLTVHIVAAEDNLVEAEDGTKVSRIGTWDTLSHPKYHGGQALKSYNAGNKLTYTFNGTSLVVMFAKTKKYGIAGINVDNGAIVQEVDLYSKSTVYQYNYTVSDSLSLGEHTVEVNVTGKLNPDSWGSFIVVDAFITTISDTAPPSINYVSPTPSNGSVQTASSTTVNVTVVDAQSDVDSAILTWNGVNETMTKVGSGKSVSFHLTKSTASEGTYAFRVWANDTAGNVNAGEERTFEIKVYNTPAGTNVRVEFVDVGLNVTFANVTKSGNTSVNVSSTGPSLPGGFNLSGNYYDISTTANYTENITVCINYDESQVSNESGLKLFHYGDSGWADVTSSLDIDDDVICGTVESLSIFVVAEPSNGITEGDVKIEGLGRLEEENRTVKIELEAKLEKGDAKGEFELKEEVLESEKKERFKAHGKIDSLYKDQDEVYRISGLAKTESGEGEEKVKKDDVSFTGSITEDEIEIVIDGRDFLVPAKVKVK